MDLQKDPAFENLCILICDDDAAILKIIEHILGQLGAAAVHSTRSPRMALQLLKEPVKKPFDLFICDWMMPEMSGLDVLKNVRNVGLQTPFVMLTGKATSDAVSQAASEGVDAYIAKPFSADEVQRKIKTVMRRTRNRR